ncbi:alpha/beta fold hydrolase [Goodfellowiella coeruleoviolacea]|uniref:Alpha/beta hydrolase family protein n=1 Tax=Goodfellowiella coeruleoviolacea TaxID=334858 RepID=A0AAE3GCJ0_9PSEU|nr:alpha/beta hydrolase [Goodfellowiella coeruleoviolacea]MCP2165752.1 Alpha/beta hydrolase family protein [Goodfellowiella coeruleoviolacea]
MSRYLLVHGSWCGGWVWDRIATRLRERGHTVITPTLTGPGETEIAEPGLMHHIHEVTRLLEDQTILVGHSYGGMVVAGAAGVRPRCVLRTVYLDAFLPSPGESAFDLLPVIRGPFTDAALGAGGRTVPPFGLDRLGFTDPDLVARLRPISMATHEEPLPWSTGGGDQPPVRYVRCGDRSPFSPMAVRARERGAECLTIATGHAGLWSTPDEVCAAITNDMGETT